ncbi:MAG: sn-glycerol-3-phosphate ABC transporter ATP-binding protein UgpC [Betaproteobacteria bacterium]|jgi:multiple sugar transport system ATP-binding protein|nr:sn-glycerol-3-phosphate ABC transporter ATP-binding protein UgpC [Pseudomonadota bacterium]NBO04243.1 sn-glycerol-3-phosphate ABC transporter ATP-binding protein UgpC [Betaproteobacteria bacterium]NBP34462.1 sn-glycerol-3-phosphate ABC transporter ATP-binding protein UgpC [Betaproteobacteria bacterium]NBP38185.1 sn-glycerol-3-phosphate ABC transporter ATP-binding protein UgpC [Betaproteobacteria bacterium]NBQ78328.1 sn-glycerol-3-phosphate ABC transporter ATP-binding protein UgpC [Betaproteo
MSSVSIRDVHKHYDDFHAVKGVSLEINDHEFVVLVGPSGCGKTTTLRMVAGLESITSGEIAIGDLVVNELPPMDRDIAMVFQNYALYPHMSVFDNMAFGLRMRKFPAEEVERRVKDAAGILGINDHLHRKPRQLSGGQRQRVALGRAIVRNPQVFLFDEPLSNLDAKLRVQMRVELKKLHARLETTSIYVTHDQVEAMTLGDRVVVMRDGLIQQVGEPFDLYSHPANKYVAGFIGSPAMNFANAQIVFSDDRAIARQEGFSIDVPSRLLSALRPYNNQTVWLGIRPEDLRTARPDDPAGICFMTSVEVAEQLGSEILLDVRCGDAAFVASVEPTLRVRPGDQVKLALTPEKLHFFDHTSEQTIR